MITADELRRLVSYDPETGVFTWRVNKGRAKAGQVAGTISGNGYRVITFRPRKYGAQRLAFLWMTGSWPPAQIDHIDMDPLNNRWSNLRPASVSQNRANTRARRNNASGLKGVHFDRLTRSSKKWVAQIKHRDTKRFLGRFATKEEAHVAYAKAAATCFGEFARAA
jgi:hypothetical protein